MTHQILGTFRRHPSLRTQLLVMMSIVPLALTLFVAPLRSAPIGEFEDHRDIGAVQRAGNASYDPNSQTYRVSGAGVNMWNNQDELHLVWKKLEGDFIVNAHAEFDDSEPAPSRDPHRKLGWIVRSSLDPQAPYVDIAVHGNGSLASLQFRRSSGAITEQIRSSVDLPDVIQLERKGNRYSMSVAEYGKPLTKKGFEEGTETELELDLGNEVYVGLFVCSHNPDVIETATFSNVRVTIPAKDDFQPYRDYIGSRLELMDIRTGARKVIHTVADSLQAPNWTRDGKYLIYNRNGKLYRYELASKQVLELDTGDIQRNNNDHVLSFDGSMLGISSSHGPDRKSTIFTLPSTGGTPTQITSSDSHSYLHSWSPDGKFLIFTAQRNGDFDIYRLPSAGGDEVNLTKTPGLDDGSEYTPGGRQIYFNSSRSGKMQIWSMLADGSNQTQITDDEYNNWFPHISPDGKSMIIISFPSNIDPDDHPFYKHVLLRQLQLDGGSPKVIAYIYGGQGTINVPSYSPDGSTIAFVSNSDGLSND